MMKNVLLDFAPHVSVPILKCMDNLEQCHTIKISETHSLLFIIKLENKLI